MRFLVDNSLSPQAARLLLQSGHDAVHVRDLKMATARDEEIFDVAARQKRILLAQDADFGTLLALRKAHLPSLVLFRCCKKSPELLHRLLLANLSAVAVDLEAGAVVVIEDTRVRIRRLPVG